MMRQLRSNVLTREQRVDRLRAKLPDGAVERMTEMARKEQARPFVPAALEVLALQGRSLAGPDPKLVTEISYVALDGLAHVSTIM